MILSFLFASREVHQGDISFIANNPLGFLVMTSSQQRVSVRCLRGLRGAKDNDSFGCFSGLPAGSDME